MRISDWSSDVCSSDLALVRDPAQQRDAAIGARQHPGRSARLGGAPVEEIPAIGQFSVRKLRRVSDGASRLAGRDRDAQGGGEGAESRGSEEHTSELQSLMRISYAVF